MLKFTSPWTGNVHDAYIQEDAYAVNGRIFLGLWTNDLDCPGGYFEPYCDITVNLPREPLTGKSCAFVDVNNAPFITRFLEENGLAEPTGVMGFSGWCAYPEYRFNMDAVREHLLKGES